MAGGLALPAGDCVQAYNLVAAENGLRVRLGSREAATGLVMDTEIGVRTLMSFRGNSTRLFAATDAGIQDVSAGGTSQALEIAFATTAANAGYGSWVVVQAAGGRFGLYADEENGLYAYTETGNTWAKVAMGPGAGQIDGVDPDNLAFVTVHKGRVWFVEKSTASAWYLPIGQVFGTAQEFPVGLSFKRGGSLVGLWSWTYDAGAGADDSLVFFSAEGDVLVYQGTDPSSADTWGLRGVWYAGPLPAGRRIASEFGGDLSFLTTQGLNTMSRLVVGEPNKQAQALTEKIANLVTVLMSQRASFLGWSIHQHPEDNTLVIIVPQGSGDEPLQLVQSLSTKGWFIHRGLRMTCATVHDKQFHFGTDSGTVNINTGYLDGIVLADTNAYTPVDWALLTATTDLGLPAQKQVGMIRPLILSEGGEPSVAVEARYRYSQTELDPVSLVSGTGDVWDSGLWDVALWAGQYTPSQPVRGATGMGTAVAIAIRGTSVSRTVLVGLDVTFVPGGFL